MEFGHRTYRSANVARISCIVAVAAALACATAADTAVFVRADPEVAPTVTRVNLVTNVPRNDPAGPIYTSALPFNPPGGLTSSTTSFPTGVLTSTTLFPTGVLTSTVAYAWLPYSYSSPIPVVMTPGIVVGLMSAGVVLGLTLAAAVFFICKRRERARRIRQDGGSAPQVVVVVENGSGSLPPPYEKPPVSPPPRGDSKLASVEKEGDLMTE